jgi:hypothetical protein
MHTTIFADSSMDGTTHTNYPFGQGNLYDQTNIYTDSNGNPYFDPNGSILIQPPYVPGNSYFNYSTKNRLNIFGIDYFFNFDVEPYILHICLINIHGSKMYDQLILQGVIFPMEINNILLSTMPSQRREEKITEILDPKESK